VELLSEDEQWEALKRWLKVNSLPILVMVALALGGYYGWKWWQGQQDMKARVAADVYRQALADFDSDKVDAALAGVEKLRKEYPKSAYVSSAELAAARVYVANTSTDDPVRPIAKMRLARVQSALGQHDKALATLGTQDMGSYQAAFLETRGDVLFAKGDRAGALKEYEAARKLLSSDSAGAEGVGPLLDLKISDLKATT
jgi:predicted negative regulator of RcsB-dependent stress response